MTYYAWDRVHIKDNAPQAAGLDGTVTGSDVFVQVKPDGWDRTVPMDPDHLTPLHPGNEDRQP